jgi:hypothetical protein
MAKGKTCNRDCFKCEFDDCIMESVSAEERKAMNQRDISYTNFGSVIQSRASRSRRRKSYI